MSDIEKLCTFAALKVFLGVTRVAQSLHRAFFMPEAHDIRRSPRDVVVMAMSSPQDRLLAAGSGRRFLCPHAKKNIL